MLTSKDTFIIIDATNAYLLNQAHKDGYELVTVIYEDCVETKMTQERQPVPQMSYGSSSGYSNNYTSNNYYSVDKEQIIVTKIPKAIMKLSATAEVIYGKTE